MLFLVFFISAFAAVGGDLLEVAYNIDENYFDSFNSAQCVDAIQWELVDYGHLKLAPPYERRSLAIRALNNSCSTSFPIVFFKGTVELTVYLRTISKYSGITVSVLGEQSERMVSVRYQKSNRNYVPGWVVVSVPVDEHTTGYVQLSGQSLNSELVIVDSLRYIPDNSTHVEIEAKTKTVTNNDIKNTPSLAVTETFKVNTFIFAFDENGSGEGEDVEGSGEYEDTGPGTENTTEDPGTEDPDNPVEEPGSANTTEESESEDTDDSEPGSANSTEESELEDTEDSEDGFWNVFTISFVAIGVFTGVGLLGVGSYFLGKNRALSQNPPIDWEALEPATDEPPITVPRARSVFSDATYDRFSRYS